MSFIAMNRFKVRLGSETDFETVWKDRQGRLNELKGFQEFRLLKGPEGDGYRLYSSHVIWDSRADFEAWTKSQQFRDSHKNAGDKTAQSPIIEHPQFEGFETILHET
ncbi:antibiotic biosynthesis monooxygenase [Ruegeria sp.]|uniref:antibiotic biosynthesis monooxygenase family protein n=1 Tax=Ruegeria sp. TaxID=1879320 RepID=UPI002316C29B|nr:antibiotic biosynthesis monooxygenase [Ruegeria sp.]MDA7964681.1 antibiotic biosynthesis monooxygenase [Ruegeria sp.]